MTLVATILILDTQTIGSTAMEHAALVKYLELEITEFVVRVLHTIPWLLESGCLTNPT